MLLTPSLELGILAGETRAALLELAARAGWAVEEGAFPLERLARRRRDLHVVLGAGGDARRRARRPGVREGPCSRGACRRRFGRRRAPEPAAGGRADRRSAAASAGRRSRPARTRPGRPARRSGPRRASTAPPTSLARASPSRATPRASRTLVGASTQTRTSYAVAKHPVERADALDRRRCPRGSTDRASRPAAASAQSHAANRAASPREQRLEHLAPEARRGRTLARPRTRPCATTCAPGIEPRQRRLPGAAMTADPDQDEGRRASPRPRSGRASAVRPRAHGTLSAWRSCGSAGWRSANGVLVHGPTAWGAAVRRRTARSASPPGRSGALPPSVTTPFVRGPLRLAEAFAVLPDVKRGLPEARFAVRAPAGRGRGPRRAPRRPAPRAARASRCPLARRSRALASLAPAALALRGGELASYHGAEHVSIGTYETGEPATKEHDRCGGHLVGPLLADERRGERARRPRARREPPGRARARRRSARSAPRSRCSPGWGATRDTRSRGRSPCPATSSSPGSRRPSRREAQLEVARGRARRLPRRREAA